ncbi:TIR domain-containing protein [Limnobacter sp.]|uniref:TIR domain-containing protein n=1 Tax=Limnobacter sp. TaxID=2003368 RepID=UPI003511D435
MPRIDEVFKKSGVPTHTFVEPDEYDRVRVAIQTPGRGVIIEGPSGIGKTSCIKRALDETGLAESCLFLSGRKQGDIPLINELPTMRSIGVVIIDDFHRLPPASKQKITDFAKTLADEEDTTSKIILIGINRAGQTLVEYAPDLLHRVETIRVGRTSVERIRQLIELGERALNCSISISSEISEEAEGSFAMAQVLCHEVCLQGKLLETRVAPEPEKIGMSLPAIREAVLADLGPRFFPIAREFSTGNKLRREGRAPYLHLLLWLSQTQEGALDTKEAMAANPDLKGSVSQVIEKGHLNNLIANSNTISELIHFESKTDLLTTEDPKFLYFIRNIIWSKFARQVGYFSIDFNSRYDFALSFAGEDRSLAESLAHELTTREISVFYDKNEQHRILANDVEEYLAPIYRSESKFVIALLSKNYPKKIWTKFESEQFKQRFGEGAVIPIWYTDTTPGLFDESRRVGGLSFDPTKENVEQLANIVEALCKKLEEMRQVEVKNSEQQSLFPASGA